MDGLNNLITNRKNIVAATCIAIQKVADNFITDSRSEYSPYTACLITALQHMFYHGLKGSMDYNKLCRSRQPWRLICSLVDIVPSECVKSIVVMDHLHYGFAKVRAWIKLSLIKQCLSANLLSVHSAIHQFRDVYSSEALLLHADFDHILRLSKMLNNIDFNLEMKRETDNYVGIPAIDYAYFLHDCAVVVDCAAERIHERLGGHVNICSESCSCNVSRCTTSNSSVPSDTVQLSGERHCHWRVAFERQLVTQRHLTEQQRYMNDLLVIRQKESEKMAADLAGYKRINRDYECSLVELQIQIMLYHEQCCEELKKFGVHDPLTLLRPPTIKQWQITGFRRDHLISRTTMANQFCSNAALFVSTNDINCGDDLLSKDSAKSAHFHLDQGIDALQLIECKGLNKSLGCESITGANYCIPKPPSHKQKCDDECGLQVNSDSTNGQQVCLDNTAQVSSVIGMHPCEKPSVRTTSDLESPSSHRYCHNSCKPSSTPKEAVDDCPRSCAEDFDSSDVKPGDIGTLFVPNPFQQEPTLLADLITPDNWVIPRQSIS